MRIALDAMGGDHAPGPIVAGAVQAVAAEPELTVVLVGDQARIEPLLTTASAEERGRLELFHCTQAVGMDEKPAEALRSKPDSSIKRCWELLASGKAAGIVSAGNTGAMVAGGHFLRRFLRPVLRPGIAAPIPTAKGLCVVLDVGANIQAKPEHLFQYGIMGSLYARHILGVDRPRIGVINVGEEEGKGVELVRNAFRMFTKSALAPEFIGNVEGRDIQRGVADVVVCEGFVGNVLLKYSEGFFSFLMKLVQKELFAPLQAERSLVEQAWGKLLERYDYSTFGGAPLLGIDGACIICHGSSGDRAIRNALGVASKFARLHLPQLIKTDLEANPPPDLNEG